MNSLLPHREAQSLRDLATKISCMNPKGNEDTPLKAFVKDTHLYPGQDKRILTS